MSFQPPPPARGPAYCASVSIDIVFDITAAQPLPVSSPMRQEFARPCPGGAYQGSQPQSANQIARPDAFSASRIVAYCASALG